MKKHIRYKVHARREVVLSAGAIGSAQLLLVSGVGPAEELRAAGVDPVLDLPVGHNLQDHVTFSGNAFIVNNSRLCVNDVVTGAFAPSSTDGDLLGILRSLLGIIQSSSSVSHTCRLSHTKVALRLGVTYEKGVTLGNVTMSHRTREGPPNACVSLPLNYDRSAARS
ncbi:Dehydrogenase patE [Eumeta japonica]|uniref:Dehydrogenase patE n=1 Tax=Eumeta variegata TaxID=151549 RepID=A0A4C1WVX6_EUMVA|nr:Dehydrogenase patE [Eumeta japonica]